jgi:chemotaxis protein MotB
MSMGRVSRQSEHEPDEGYFASVSDLMVGILFIFLLMVTILALNYHEQDEQEMVSKSRYDTVQKALGKAIEELKKRDLRESHIASLEAALAKAETLLSQEAERSVAARRELMAELSGRLNERGVKFEVVEDSGVLRFAEEIQFETGQYEVTQRSSGKVAALAEVLSEVLPCYTLNPPAALCPEPKSRTIDTLMIEGHTDSQGFGDVQESEWPKRNDELSARRALAVFTKLREATPLLDELRNGSGAKILALSGYGQRRPVKDGQINAIENRRIDLRFILSSVTQKDIEALSNEINGLMASRRSDDLGSLIQSLEAVYEGRQ